MASRILAADEIGSPHLNPLPEGEGILVEWRIIP